MKWLLVIFYNIKDKGRPVYQPSPTMDETMEVAVLRDASGGEAQDGDPDID